MQSSSRTSLALGKTYQSSKEPTSVTATVLDVPPRLGHRQSPGCALEGTWEGTPHLPPCIPQWKAPFCVPEAVVWLDNFRLNCLGLDNLVDGNAHYFKIQ